MFRYDFKNRSLIPSIKDDNADYLLRLSPVLARENIQPVNVMRLRDAAFCIEHRIPLFTEEAEHRVLRNNEEYNRLADRYGTDRFVIRGGQAIFPTYTAVECGSDIFLFTKTRTGDAALHDYLQYQANSFFGDKLQPDKLRLYDIAPAGVDLSHKADTRTQFTNLLNRSAGKKSMFEIDCQFSSEMLRYGICTAEFPMYPSIENYRNFIANVSQGITSSQRNEAALRLLYIFERGYSEKDFKEQFPNPCLYFSEGPYKDIIQACRFTGTQEDIARKIKSDQQNLAAQNLYKHYPALFVKHLNKENRKEFDN